MRKPPVVAVWGTAWPDLEAAVTAGAGGVLGELQDADAVIALESGGPLPALPASVRWVQLPGAGVEAYFAGDVLDAARVWTSAAGAYAATVGEHAVGLLLAGVRGVVTAASLHSWQPDRVGPSVTGLAGTTVAIVGAGGIGRHVAELLAPFEVTVIAVNRSGAAVPGVARTLQSDRLIEVLDEVDHIVLAAPATAQTRNLIDAEALRKLRPHSWIVNVGRGALIDSDALIDALNEGRIAGAALDVTDPEPLPDESPLWQTPGVLITPHTANPAPHRFAAYVRRVRENVERFAGGRELLGVIELDRGY